VRRAGWILFASWLLVIGCQQQPTNEAASPSSSTSDLIAASEPPPATTPQAPEAEPAPHFMVSDQIDTTVDGKGEGPYHSRAAGTRT
jgi:hypothetical protein